MAGNLMRDEGIGIRFESDLAPLIKANDLTDKLVDKWAIINRELSKSGDTTSFSRGMARSNDQIKRNIDSTGRLRSQINETTSDMRRMGNQGSNAMNQVAHDGSALGRTYSSVKDKASGMWRKVNDSEAARKTNADLNKVQDNLSQVGSSAKKSSNRVSESQRKTRSETERTTTSFGRLRNAGSRLANMGNTIALAMLPVAAAFKKSADEATELENRYKTIQNLLHTGGESAAASKAQSKAMAKENNGFALQYGVSPTEMAKGGEELVRRGYSGAQELASHKYFLQAARASGDSYNSVVGYGAPALEQFGYKTKAGNSRKKMAAYTKMVLNQMAYGADLSATDFSGMGESLKYAGATAKSGNQSLASTISDIGVLSNNGQDGSIAGTGLKKVINSLLAPSSGPKGQGAQALKSLGLTPDDLRDSKGNLMSLDKEFQLLNSHMTGMNGTQKATIFHKLFGATGQESALILSANVKQMKDLDSQVAHAPKYGKNGYIQNLAQKNMSSWQNQIDVFKQHLNVMGLDFTKTVLPGFTKLLSVGNKFLGALIKMPEPVKKLVGYTTAVASGLAVAYTTSKLFKKGFNWLNGTSSGTTVANRATDVVEDGLGEATRTGTTHYSGGSLANLPSKLNNATSIHTGIGKMAAVGTGLSIGVSAVSAIHDGLDSKKGGREMWSAGGQAAGAGVGLALSAGNPVAAAIGASIGGSIGTAFADSPAVKQLGTYLKSIDTIESSNQSTSDHGNNHTYGNHTQQAQYGQNVQHTKSRRGLTDVYSTGLTTGGNTHKSKSAPRKLTLADNIASMQAASNANFKKMAGDSWGFISKSLSLEKKANSEWASSTSKSYSAVSNTYQRLDTLAQKYAGKQEATNKKNLSYLEKNGLLTKAQAQNDYKTTKGYYSKRLSALHSNINNLINDDKSGGKKRIADIQRVNAEILSLTDKGGQKQKTLLSQLNNRSRRLTVAGYGKIISESDHAYKKTTSNAKKQYNTEVKSANDRYKKAVSIARSTKGLSASQRATIISNAKKQKNSSVANAKTQYSGTLKWARQQRRDVVKQAQIEAGSAKDAFSKAAKDVGNSIPALITQNLKIGLSTANPKFHSGDLTNNIAKNNGRSNAGSTGSPKRPKSYKGPYNGADLTKFATHANGGKISRTQTALVGEGGPELAYTVRGKNARLLGVNGPQMARLKPGEHILNAMSTRRVLAGNYGQSLPGYAQGTNGLKASSVGRTMSRASNDTTKSTHKMKRNTLKDFDSMQKGSTASLSKLSKHNRSSWGGISSKTGHYTNNIRKSSVKDFDSMQKGVQGQMNQLRKGVTNAADDTAVGFGHALGRMDNYAHKAMSNTISQLNKGIKGIDKSLGQFGGNNSVINPIHYAAGSNGQLTEDQIAMVNDAPSGPRQEGIVRGGQLYAPKGNNRVLGLQRGDAVLNGSQMQRLMRSNGITHYAKGSGVSDSALRSIAKTNAKNPASFWNKNFNVNVKVQGPDLQKGITKTAKSGMTKYGVPWANAGWNVIEGLIQNTVSSNAGMVKAMKKYGAGHPYVWGGSGPDNFDCSGLVMYALKHAYGISVPHNSGAQYSDTSVFKHISPSSAKPGDALFWGPGEHVGIYEGHGKYYSAFSDTPPHGHPQIGSYPVHGYGGTGQLLAARIKGVPSGTSNKKASKGNPLARLFKKEIGNKALKWVENNLEVSGGSFGGQMGGSSITKAMIEKAEQVMKIPQSIRGKIMSNILKVAMSETGNTNEMQKIHDINSASGNPAGGPLQFTKSTFNTFAAPGHKNWASPYDQVLAYLNNSQYRTAAGMTTIRGTTKFDWLNSGPHGHPRFAKGGIPKTNRASLVGERGAELFMPSVSGRVFTAKDTANMAYNMAKASLNVMKMLRELDAVIRRPSTVPTRNRRSIPAGSAIHIETHDKFEFHIGSGTDLNERSVAKMIKEAVKRERQSMARQIIEQFGGAK